ncbi:MAG: cobalt ABC transporter ATPase [Peptococcaceae bacterium BICA1-8]|nr:MAG: cobalt ABC transporter ATPase [Peptococcaceae bacterium BICA1-8]
MSEIILEARNIDFSYMDGTKAINNLSIRIPKGKKVAVLGNNGAGKTTLFLHFNGVHRPQKGEILYKGELVNYKKNQLRELRKNIGIVFQDPDNQLFSASVYQDVSFGPNNLGWGEEKIRNKIEEVMKQTGTWELRDKPTHALSHGQKKRVAIAGVLAMEPEVIFLDEPTAGLDPMYSNNIMQLLDEFNQGERTVIVSSHNIDEVYAWADYVLIMHSGQIISEGVPEDVFRNQETIQKANLIKPWVLEIYDYLVEKNRSGPGIVIPKTREDIMKIL